VGHTSDDIDATREMWEFFQKNPISSGVLVSVG